ncbi:hypothetical protein KY362_06015 [Candidatus Woesearchaeota archaeon]|nr:hypothetical protein [Candidatus Woesearchaeota archaeon]
MKKSVLSTGWIIFSIITLGIAEIITQLVTIREFLSVFYGNELVIGILLANWLLISGIASHIGRKSPKIVDKGRVLIAFHIIVAFLLPCYIYVIRNLYNFVFIRGELISITGIFITAFLVLLPVCAVTGFSLPLFSVLYSKRQSPKQVGRVYFFDSVSNIIGGLAFSFILIYLLNPFHIALLILIINLVAASALLIKTRRAAAAYVVFLILVLSAIICVKFDWNGITTIQQYPGQDVIASADSVYGRYVLTRTDGQLNFFENSAPLFSTDDPVSVEERVHYTMLQHPAPKSVLLISGGVSGTTVEALKYAPDKVDYVELDPAVSALGRRYTANLENETIQVYNTDARLFIRQAFASYDAVIIDLPDPGTAATNRLYTSDFFAELKQVLNPGAVVGLGISSGENYVSDETANLDAAVYNSLKDNFKNILLLPGDTAYFIASDSGLSYDAYRDINQRIETEFVNEDYMYSRLDPQRIGVLESAVQAHSLTNRDFRPVAYYYHLLYWLKHFQVNYILFLALLIAFIIFTLWRIRPVPFAVFTAGFAGIALELVLIIGFQILYGNVYHKIGILITSFMIGLALGAWFVNRTIDRWERSCLTIILLFMFLFALFLPLAFLLMRGIASPALLNMTTAAVFPLLTVLIAAFVGSLFPLAAKFHFRENTAGRRVAKDRGVAPTAGALFFYDYAGATVGAIIISALLIPLLGIFTTCILVAFLCLAAAAVNRFL